MLDRKQWVLNRCEMYKIDNSIIDNSMNILDVGSADGWIFKDTNLQKHVTFVDLDKYDMPNFYQMDAHNLQFQDKSFDIVVLGEILEHADDPVQVLKEAKRVGKRILITVPDEKGWDEKYYPYETIEQGMKRRNLTLEEIVKVSNPNTKEFYTKDNYKHLFHNRHYTESTLKQELEFANIKDYKLEKLQYGEPQWAFFAVDINPTNSTQFDTTTFTNEPKYTHGTGPIKYTTGPIITTFTPTTFTPDIKINTNILSNKTNKLNKLRVALISTPFFGVPPTKYGGLEQIVWDLAEGLDELGHIVTLFAPEGSKTPKHGSLVVTGPSLDTVNIDWYKEEERVYQKYKDIILPDNFDIVSDHSWFAFAYLQKMNNLKLKVTHTHHGGYQWPTPPPFPKPNLISISKWMKQYTEQYFKQKGFPIQSEYVYNGIDLDKYPYQQLKTEHLLFVGRLSTFKQPHIAIEVARKTNHKLDIIGGTFIDSQDYVIQLDKMVENDQNINIYKDASHEFKLKKMQDAKALILPSKMAEPFGLVAIEAMACGTPIIALNDGALSEIVDHNKTGFICNDVQEMVEAVYKIDQIKPEDCRHRAELFSRKVMADNYAKLYQSIIRGEDW